MKPGIGPIGVFTTACEDVSFGRTQEIGRELEDLDYSAIWVPETVGDALVTSSLLLAATSRVAVGAGVSSIWSRDATAMNGAQRRLEQAFPGRFVLGLGVSHEFIVEGVRGQPAYTKPFARMSAYLDDMDGARSAAALMDQVADEGLTALTAGEVGELPPRLPRLLAALGPRMLALSTEKADGPLLYFQTPQHTKEVRASLGPDAFVAVVQMVAVEEDPVVGRAAARRMLELYSFLPSFVTHFGRLGFSEDELEDGGSDDLVDAVFACGDVDLAAQRVREHLEAGADHVAVQVVLPTWPRGVPSRQWRDLADALGGASRRGRTGARR